MILYIDTSNREKIVIGIDEKKFEASAKEGSSQTLLVFINKILTDENKTLKDIAEIKVNSGPGSFTGLRVGVAVAQTLAWQLKVPLNGKDVLTQGVEITYK